MNWPTLPKFIEKFPTLPQQWRDWFRVYLSIPYKKGQTTTTEEAVPAARPFTLFVNLTVVAMNAFPAGTRVFFWAANAQIVYGTVQSTSRLADGTQVLVIKDDNGRTVTLPAAGVTKVT